MSRAEAITRPRPALKSLGWLIVTLYVAGTGVAVWSDSNISVYPPGPLAESIGLPLAFGWFALVGAVIVSRRPRNLMGWILVAAALPLILSSAGNSYAAYLVLERGYEPGLIVSLIAWPNNWYWYVTIVLIFVYIPLLFPTGRLLSARWRIVPWLAAVGAGGIVASGAAAENIGFQVSQTEEGPGATIPNPLGVEGLAHVEQLPIIVLFGCLFLAALVGAFASLVVRFRRSRGVERQQMKWLVFAAALVPPTIGLEILLEVIGSETTHVLQGVGFLATVNAIPLAIGLAILRYRLYDIDRIVSRTVGYGLLSAVLVGVYAVGVLGFGGLVGSMTRGDGGDLVVAASTLAVAALFGPARRRIQAAVDRRFDRTRYDAHRTIEEFAKGLRDEVDLAALSMRLGRTVSATMEPRSVSLWLPTGAVDR